MALTKHIQNISRIALSVMNAKHNLSCAEFDLGKIYFHFLSFVDDKNLFSCIFNIISFQHADISSSNVIDLVLPQYSVFSTIRGNALHLILLIWCWIFTQCMKCSFRAFTVPPIFTQINHGSCKLRNHHFYRGYTLICVYVHNLILKIFLTSFTYRQSVF